MWHYASLSSANNIWIVGSFPKQPAANTAINGWKFLADMLLLCYTLQFLFKYPKTACLSVLLVFNRHLKRSESSSILNLQKRTRPNIGFVVETTVTPDLKSTVDPNWFKIHPKTFPNNVKNIRVLELGTNICTEKKKQ